MKVNAIFYKNTLKRPPHLNVYRPHFVIKGTDDYLGIQFENLAEMPFGTNIVCNVRLLYNGVDYSKLTANTAFLIMEGDNIVGEGVVIE